MSSQQHAGKIGDHGDEPEDRLTRNAKAAGGSDNCIDVNITELGATLLGVTPGDVMLVEVYHDHIRIAPANWSDHGDEHDGDHDGEQPEQPAAPTQP